METQLRGVLEAAYRDFHDQNRKSEDAIHFIHQYKKAKDQEVVAFLSALLAYGNVRTILNSVKRVLDALGSSPYECILDQRFTGKLKSFRHRFTTGEDLEILFFRLSSILRKQKDLQEFFLDSSTDSFEDQISSFVERFHEVKVPKQLAGSLPRRQRNLKYLLSTPKDGSACKRVNLFLRWVVRRNDGIDLGLWDKLSPADLFLPVDTHLLKTLQRLKWTHSKTANWKVVTQSTEMLRKLDPTDPVRYDFSLCHLSMLGGDILDYVKSGVGNVPARSRQLHKKSQRTKLPG